MHAAIVNSCNIRPVLCVNVPEIVYGYSTNGKSRCLEAEALNNEIKTQHDIILNSDANQQELFNKYITSKREAFYKKLVATAAKLGEKLNAAMVLRCENGYYVDPEYDITNKTIKCLNEMYLQEQLAKMAPGTECHCECK
jgi:hypothetical protein